MFVKELHATNGSKKISAESTLDGINDDMESTDQCDGFDYVYQDSKD